MTQRFAIRSFEEVGPLRFGMSRSEVRRRLEEQPEEFRKTSDSPMTSDSFPMQEVIAYYDTEDRLEALEFYGAVVPIWNDILLLGRPVKATFADVKPHSSKMEIDADSVTFHDLGFGFYLLDWRENQSELPESVIVFKKLYYESYGFTLPN
jgi:hypothetical protein